MLVRKAIYADLQQIVDLYNAEVLSSTATFENTVQTVNSRKEWFENHDDTHPLMVAVDSGKVAGYCCLSKFQSNSGYNRTAELSVYVRKDYRRKGVANALMENVLARARDLGYHAIISSISADNIASIKLHEKIGFEQAARLKQVGYKFDKWHDTCYYELIL